MKPPHILNRELKRQHGRMVEANLRMLEQHEIIRDQREKLTEANLKLLERTEELAAARERAWKLLLNILPEKVATDLELRGKTRARGFNNVTVLFSDIVDFTRKSGRIAPRTLIGELNQIFTAFDEIAEKNGCERIKTIGDAYLCVCGMPVPDKDHAVKMVRMAKGMVAYLRARNRTSRHKWEIRVGIHTGRVVGAVVGVRKYIYDVFGDTVNLASRMEHHSESMKVNISEAVAKLVKGKCKLIERPCLQVKGKGKLRMYFVD